MYSSSSTDDKKKLGSASQPPLEISPYDVTAMGIPVSSGNHKFPFQTPGGDPESEGLWSTSIFGCFDDIPNCCITCWCPCITFGQISEIVNEGSISCPAAGALYALIGLVTGCACFYSCLYRSKLRHQYALPETPCHDCLVHCFCELCALCQEYRELKNRGFDMSRGWKGNMEKQNYGVTMAPVVEKGMSK